MTTLDHAVVVGSGLAGVLTAAVLARYAGHVTVVDRDELPAGPSLRKGVPQAHHAHLLMGGGALAIEELLPGALAELYLAGARRIELPEDLVALTAYGWQNRFAGTHFMISCGRALLDWVIRDLVLRDERITLRPSTEVMDLTGDHTHITGVALRDAGPLAANLVVDASGRGSRARNWLLALGVPPVKADTVDSGLAYATRVFETPDGLPDRFPAITIMADVRSDAPGQNGVLLPIEDDRWIVTVSGTRGGEPPTDEDAFVAFARGLRHPLIGDLVANAEPVGRVHSSRSTVNRRTYFEQVPQWPAGLLVLGDALAAFNPIYGHGMSCAALSAAALDRVLRGRPPSEELAARAQRAAAASVNDAWRFATSQDVRYPGVRTRLTHKGDENESRAIVDALGGLALVDPVVSAAQFAVSTLSGSAAGLPHQYLSRLPRTAIDPAPVEPPLRPDEAAFVAARP